MAATMIAPPARNFALPVIAVPTGARGAARRAPARAESAAASSRRTRPRRWHRRRTRSPSCRASSSREHLLEAGDLHATREEVREQEGEGEPVDEERQGD